MQTENKKPVLPGENPLGELRHQVENLLDMFEIKDIRRQLHTNLFYKASVTGQLDIEDIELSHYLLCLVEEADHCRQLGRLSDGH